MSSLPTTPRPPLLPELRPPPTSLSLPPPLPTTTTTCKHLHLLSTLPTIPSATPRAQPGHLLPELRPPPVTASQLPLSPPPATSLPANLRSDLGHVLKDNPAVLDGPPASGDMFSHDFLNKKLLEKAYGMEKGAMFAYLRREFESFKSAFGKQAGEIFLEQITKALYPIVDKDGELVDEEPILLADFCKVVWEEPAQSGTPAVIPVAAGAKSDDLYVDSGREPINQNGMEPSFSQTILPPEKSPLAGFQPPAAIPAISPAASEAGLVNGVKGGPKSHVATTLEIPKSHDESTIGGDNGPTLSPTKPSTSMGLAVLPSLHKPNAYHTHFPPISSNFSPPKPISKFPSSSLSKSASNTPGHPGPPLTGQLLTSQPLSSLIPSKFDNNTSTSAANLPSGLGSTTIPHPPSTAPISWANQIKQQTQRLSLNFVKPTLNDKGLLALENGTSNEGENIWKHTIVGYSIDRRLPFKLLQQRIWSLWGVFGLQDIRVNKEGFLLFTFKEEKGVEEVLSKGPWIVLGQQIHIKQWRRNFDFCRDEFKSITNWIKLYGIPTTYWSSSGLSAIASRVGKPLYADEITSSAKLLDFARVCVEMEVGSEFPSSFRVLTEFEEEFEVRVEYGWRPRFCTACKIIGHLEVNCPKKFSPNLAPIPTLAGKSGHWIPKLKPSSSEPLQDTPPVTSTHVPPPDHACAQPKPCPPAFLKQGVVNNIGSPNRPPSPSPPSPRTSTPNTSTSIHNPFKALEDMVDKGLEVVANLGSTKGSPSGQPWSGTCDSLEDATPISMGWGKKIKHLDRRKKKILQDSDPRKGNASGSKRGKRK